MSRRRDARVLVSSHTYAGFWGCGILGGMPANLIALASVHPWMLALIAAALSVASLVGGALMLRRAPAVAAALFGGILGGIAGFASARASGPKGLPLEVAVWASWGLCIFGVAGMAATRGKGSPRSMKRAAVGLLIAGPVGAAILDLLVVIACPLYVTGRRVGACHYDLDLLGGWAAGVSILFGFDMVVLATLLSISAGQASRREHEDFPARWRTQPPLD